MTKKYVIAFLLACSVVSAAPFEPPAAIFDTASCLISHLRVRDHSDWAVVYQDKSGVWRMFVGMKSFLEFIHYPEKYVGEPTRHGGDIYVRDYLTKKWIPAMFAYFVVGDSIMGPNGRDAISFESRKNAEKYQKKHSACAILRFMAMRRSVLAYLKGISPDSTDVDSVIVPKVLEVKRPRGS